MPVEPTRKGYIEVWKNDLRISRHTSEWEAMESVSEQPAGLYEIRFPVIMARVYGIVSDADPGDQEAPSQPQNLSAVATSATEITLTWSASTDNVAVQEYQIYQNGVPLDSTPALTYDVSGLSPSTLYTYIVAASDERGNQSLFSDPAQATTFPNAAPIWSGLGDQTYDNGDPVNISLDAYATDADGDTITYSLVSGAFPTGVDFAGARNEIVQGTVTVDGTYNFTLGASDGIAAVQNLALEFTVVTPDVTAPDPPAAPTVSAFGPYSVTLTLPVSAAPDHASYTVLRSDNDVDFSPVEAGVTTSTWQQTGLNSDTLYYYALIDYDTSGNPSTRGASLPVTTAPLVTADVAGPRDFEDSVLTPTIYVSVAGGGDGSSPASTLTLAQANAAVGPGDVVSMRGGTYNTKINPTVGGTDQNNRLTYQNYIGETPVISNLGNNATAIDLNGNSYITIHGINVDGINHPSSVVEANQNGVLQAKGATIGTWVGMTNANYCAIQYCDFTRANGYSGIRIDGTASYNVIRDTYMSILGVVGATGSSGNGDGIDVREETKYNLVEYCDARYVGHNIFVLYGEFNVIQYTIFDCSRWDGNDGTFDTVNGYGGRIGILKQFTGSNPLTHGHQLFQHNLSLGSYLPWDDVNGSRQGDCHRIVGWETITRFNTFQKAGGNAVDVRTITDSRVTRDNWVYNNTITDWNYYDYLNFDSAFWTNGQAGPPVELWDNMFLNNAVSAPANPPRNSYEMRLNALYWKAGEPWSNNRVWNNSFEQASNEVLVTGTDRGTDTLAARQALYPEFDSNLFNQTVSLTGGRDLTTITSASNTDQTVFRVAEAYGFFPGIPELGMLGDEIRINRTGSLTRITDIDYATGDITVNPAVSWTQGDGVSLDSMVSAGDVVTGANVNTNITPGSDPVWSNADQLLEVNRAYNLNFDNYCTDPDGGSLTYTLVSGTQPLGMDFQGTRGEQLDGTPTTDAIYTFTMRATDPDGRTADLFITIETTLADVTPPPVPDAPVLTDYASNYVLLSQPANPDADHDNYRIQRSLDDVNWGTIKFGWRAADGDYVDDGVNSSTTYYYRLISIDAVPSPDQNISDPGPSVSVTTKPIDEQYIFGTPLDTGFLQNSTASNSLCPVSCTVIDAKGGTFEFGDNGYYKYTRGITGETGTASFRFTLWDEDGAGAFSTAVFSLTVL